MKRKPYWPAIVSVTLASALLGVSVPKFIEIQKTEVPKEMSDFSKELKSLNSKMDKLIQVSEQNRDNNGANNKVVVKISNKTKPVILPEVR